MTLLRNDLDPRGRRSDLDVNGACEADSDEIPPNDRDSDIARIVPLNAAFFFVALIIGYLWRKVEIPRLRSSAYRRQGSVRWRTHAARPARRPEPGRERRTNLEKAK
jgi:hypothetical protein